MNLRQEKKLRSYDKLRHFFIEFGDALTASNPSIGVARTEFNARWDAMMPLQKVIVWYKARLRLIRKECAANALKACGN